MAMSQPSEQSREPFASVHVSGNLTAFFAVTRFGVNPKNRFKSLPD